MRLKFLFFPIVLIICIAIFAGYIWPEINNVRTGNDEKKANIQELEKVQKRKSDIDALGNRLVVDVEDIDDKKIVDNYLPSSNVEERIIGGINYLAADAGLALLDISMKASLENKSANSIVTNNVTTENSTKDKAVNNMQFNETSILISGEYEKIGLFIDKLQKMALLNSINSLTIKKISGTVSDNTDKQVSDSKNLNAEIIVKFGYLKTVNSDNQIANVDPKLDKETVDALRFYVSAKDVSTSAISEPALKGKKNPFFLE